MSLIITPTTSEGIVANFQFVSGQFQIFKDGIWADHRGEYASGGIEPLEIRGYSLVTDMDQHFQFTTPVEISGSINALIDFEEGSSTFATNNQFAYLFAGNTNIVDISEMTFPEKTLRAGCYKAMFAGCTGIVDPPASLPATSLAESCYDGMFYGCTSLTNVPEMPVANLKSYSHQSMFSGCSALIGHTTSTGYYTKALTFGSDEEAPIDWNKGTFANTSSTGTLPTDPSAGTTYYFYAEPESPITDVKILPDYGKYKKG